MLLEIGGSIMTTQSDELSSKEVLRGLLFILLVGVGVGIGGAVVYEATCNRLLAFGIILIATVLSIPISFANLGK